MSAIRLLPALPLALCTAALGLASRLWPLCAILGAILLLCAALGPRLPLLPLGQVMLALVSFGLGVLAALLGGQVESQLHPLWSGIAAATLLCAAGRLLVRAPLFGALGTFALGLTALVACGATHSGPRYSAIVFLYLLSTIAVFRAGDAHRPPLYALSPRGRAVLLLLPLLGAAQFLAAMAPLVPLYNWIQGRFDRAYGRDPLRTGFGERFRLGALDGLLESDEIVLRIYENGAPGGAPDLLRGLVYDNYDGGRWSTVPARPHRLAVGKGRPGQGALELRPEGGPAYLFLPFALASLYTESGAAIAGAHGGLRPIAADAGRPLWLHMGERRVQPLPPPTEVDLKVPVAIENALGDLSDTIVAGETTAEGKLRRIIDKLQRGYRYSLHFTRTPGVDPVVDFLTHNREGHCEYFASSMALLGRLAGVPTRVVGGYRVAERSQLGGYLIVRERDAHAWVEAYLPGRGWTTFDPTPAGALPLQLGQRRGMGSELLDLISTRAGAALSFLVERPLAVALPAAALTAALVLLLYRRRRRGIRRAVLAPGYGPSSPGFLRLLFALSHRGTPWSPSEPIERYAARIADAQAAALLRRYAALRYGGQGDPASLEAELAAHAERLLARP